MTEATRRLANRGRLRYAGMYRDAQRNKAYSDFFKENAKGKVICDLGAGTGCLLSLAQYYGAKKCIGIERLYYPCIFMKETYPHWDILQGNFNEHEWPEADIYIHEVIGHNFYEEGVASLFKTARDKGLEHKLYPNTVKLYTLDDFKDGAWGVDSGGVLNKASQNYLKEIAKLEVEVEKEHSNGRQAHAWHNYTNAFTKKTEIFSGSIVDGYDVLYSGKSKLGWECGFDNKYTFSNMGLSSWVVSGNWNFKYE